MKRTKITPNRLVPLKRIAYMFGVKLYISKSLYHSYSYVKKSYIHLKMKSLKGTYLSLEQIYSLFFHELAHILIYRDGKFPLIHKKDHLNCFLTKEEIIGIRRTILQFELYTDNYGQKLLKSFFPEVRYVKNYRNHFEKLQLKDSTMKYLASDINELKLAN